MKPAFATLLLLVAAVLGLVEFLAIVDPIGTRMADDGTPFGDPYSSWIVHAALVAAIWALVVAAALLLRRKKED